MQKLVYFLVLLQTIIQLACNNKPDTYGMKEYKNDSLHFSILLPENWSIKNKPTHRYALMFNEPKKSEKDSFSENMIIWMEPLPIQISDSLYAKSNLGHFKITKPHLTLQEEPIFIGTHTRLFPFTFHYDSKNVMYKIQGYTCVKDTLAYNISCTYPESKKKEYEPLFKKIINSFKPL